MRMLFVLAVCVLGIAGAVQAQTDAGVGATRPTNAAARPKTGSVQAPGAPVRVSNLRTGSCYTRRCVTTVVIDRQVTPEMWYAVAEVLAEAEQRASSPIALCIAGRSLRECPTIGQFNEELTRDPDEPLNSLKDQINFGQLGGVPGCFVLRWSAGRPNERVSLPFAIQSVTEDPFPCR